MLKTLVLLRKNKYFSDFLVAMPSGPDQVGWVCREDGKLAGWPAGCLADWLLAGRLAGWLAGWLAGLSPVLFLKSRLREHVLTFSC